MMDKARRGPSDKTVIRGLGSIIVAKAPTGPVIENDALAKLRRRLDRVFAPVAAQPMPQTLITLIENVERKLKS